MTRFAIHIGLTLFLLHSASAQPYWIDARSGVDQPGGGSSSQPFKTLSYATRQAPAGGGAAFFLNPGTYGTASGETFPILLPDSCVVRSSPRVAKGSRQVVIEAPLALTTSFQWAPSQSGTLELEGLSFRGGMFRALQVFGSGQRSRLYARLRDCRFAQSRCIAVNLDQGADALFEVEECSLTGIDAPVILRSSSGALLRMNVDRSTLDSGTLAGCWIDASGSGQVQLRLRSSIVRNCPRHGILIETGPMAGILVRVEHSLFEDLGNQIIIGPAPWFGGILETGTGTPPRVEIVNSIFRGNRQDAPLGTASNYIWGTNFVEQPSLIGVGGNRVGTATFVGSTFHPAPSSGAIDQGDPAAVTLLVDHHGILRDGSPDLGPGEFWNELLFAQRDAVPTNASPIQVDYLTTSRPGLAFVLWFDIAANTLSFGPGLYHLVNPPVDLGVGGVVDARGIGRATLTVPPNVPVLGLELFAQAVYAQPPFLGVNPYRIVFAQ